jgi:hypothetical protein
MAILTLGLQNLRRQVDEAFPGRDKASDGWIGNAAHQAETSGHNPDDTAGSRPAWDGDTDSVKEVRAWDCDNDFGGGVDAQVVVDHIRRLPGVAGVLRYMIYNRKEYHSRNGFEPTAYSGASAHTEHIHFEGAFSQAADNNTTFNFRLEEIPVALTAADKTWLAGVVDARADALEATILAKLTGVPAAVWAGPKLNVHVGKGEAPSLQTPGDILRYLSPEGKQGRDLTLAVGKDVADLAEKLTTPPTA